jgi:hypothetical protein
MTTAHRPTWAPARGGEEQGGNRLFVPSLMRSSKDATAHTKLKLRQDGQGATGSDLKVREEGQRRVCVSFCLSPSLALSLTLFARARLSLPPNHPIQTQSTTGGAAPRGAQGGRQEAGAGVRG